MALPVNIVGRMVLQRAGGGPRDIDADGGLEPVTAPLGSVGADFRLPGLVLLYEARPPLAK